MSIVGICRGRPRPVDGDHLRAADLGPRAWWPASLSIGLSLLLVRPLKGMLIALQYSNKAEQGRFEP